ncbi:MAG: TlpA family protein disulfide reductase [Elusimicrobiota bacterium]
MRYKIFIFLMMGLVANFHLASGAGRRGPDVEESGGEVAGEIHEGATAPDITFVDLHGNEKSLSDYRGKAILLNFWATWCPPCKYEKPFMQEVYDDYKEEGFVVIAVSVREQKETVENYVKSNGYTYPVFLDLNGDAFAVYDRTGGIPQSYLIDRQGKISSFISGARKWTESQNRTLIESIIKE